MSAAPSQLPLFGASETLEARDLPQRFKQVYFHLYSNSNASRAESLLADLSLLLLAKLCSERHPKATSFHAFLAGKSSANRSLLPALRLAFPRLIDDADRFRLRDESLRHALAELIDVQLSSCASHVLGEAFQALIGPRIRGEKGQFFTPRSLVRAMVSIVDPRPGDSILDPACGTGGFLYEAMTHIERNHGRPGSVHGCDKDKDLSRLSAALIASRTDSALVTNGNSLDADVWTSMGLLDSYDVILTNPPFGTKIPIRDSRILRSYDLGYEWHFDESRQRWLKGSEPLAAQDPQVLFLELCIRKLRQGGRLAIVLPEGLFGNKQEAFIWDFVREHGQVAALLDCPRTTFQPGTDTKTNVLFFEKRRSTPNKKVPVAVAIACGHDRRGRSLRSDGSPYPDDFPAIGQALRLTGSKQQAVHPWRVLAIGNPYYLVPRYYADGCEDSNEDPQIIEGAEWCTLADLRKNGLVEIRKGHEVGSESYGTGDVPFIRTSDITNLEVSCDPTKSVSEDIYEEYSRQQKLKKGSILMVVDGRYRIGATAILTERSAKCVVQSHLRIIDTLEPKDLDPYSLLFALNLPSVRRRIRGLVFIQSTLGTLGPRLLELRVPLLHANGPWSATVRAFKTNLEQRDRLLGELGGMIAPDVEL